MSTEKAAYRYRTILEARDRIRELEAERARCGAHGDHWKARAEKAEARVAEHHNATLMAPWFNGDAGTAWGTPCPACLQREGGRESGVAATEGSRRAVGVPPTVRPASAAKPPSHDPPKPQYARVLEDAEDQECGT